MWPLGRHLAPCGFIDPEYNLNMAMHQAILEAAAQKDQPLLHGLRLAAQQLLSSFPLLQPPRSTASSGLPYLGAGAAESSEAAAQLPAQVALLRGLTALAEMALPPDLALLPAELRLRLPQR